MKNGRFIVGLGAVGVVALAAGLGAALLMSDGGGSEQPIVVLPTVVVAPPEIEINTGDGPPLAFLGRMEALSEIQKKQLELSIADQGLDKDGPIGVVVWSDGSATAFKIEDGPPEPPAGMDQGAVDVFMFPEGLPIDF